GPSHLRRRGTNGFSTNKRTFVTLFDRPVGAASAAGVKSFIAMKLNAIHIDLLIIRFTMMWRRPGRPADRRQDHCPAVATEGTLMRALLFSSLAGMMCLICGCSQTSSPRSEVSSGSSTSARDDQAIERLE